MAYSPPIVDATGIHVSGYWDYQNWLAEKFKIIYGADIYLGNDSQDGQLIGVYAQALADTAGLAVGVYNSFSPATAIGNGLSRIIKINGLARNLSSHSSAALTVIGQAGTTVNFGIVKDEFGNSWNLPATFTIPPSGEIIVLATCQTLGSISAAPNTITQIATPTNGWQTVTNEEASTVGSPVESDAAVRARQATSTAIPSLTVLDGIVGAVLGLSGVIGCIPYENDTDMTDANGLPPHSIALVVSGGDPAEIARTIYRKKGPGCSTYGNTPITFLNQYELSVTINYFVPEQVNVIVDVTLHPLLGYAAATGVQVQQAIQAYINNLGSGVSVIQNRLNLPANLNGIPLSETYEVTALTIVGGSPDRAIAFYQQAVCTTVNLTVD